MGKTELLLGGLAVSKPSVVPVARSCQGNKNNCPKHLQRTPRALKPHGDRAGTPISTPKCDPESPRRAEHPNFAENSGNKCKTEAQQQLGAWRESDHEGKLRGLKQNPGLNRGFGRVLSVPRPPRTDFPSGRAQHSPNPPQLIPGKSQTLSPSWVKVPLRGCHPCQHHGVPSEDTALELLSHLQTHTGF